MKPVIGITMYSGANMLAAEIQVATQHLPELYSDAVSDAGGLPVLFPAGETMSEAADSVGMVDGILLPGGPDIDPAVYGQTMRPTTGTPDIHRDRWEAAIFACAMVHRIPILGICRGMQLINVALGGTLQQQLEHVELHAGAGYILHPVMIEPDSLLGGIMPYEDEAVMVLTRHHQGIDRVADNLTVSAYAQDGTIEAIEHTDDDLFVLGVQWHPERDPDQSVFAALVQEAGKIRTAKNG